MKKPIQHASGRHLFMYGCLTVGTMAETIRLDSDGTGDAAPLLFSSSLGVGGEVFSGPLSLLPHSIVSSSMLVGVLIGWLLANIWAPLLATTGGGLTTSSAGISGPVGRVLVV